MSTSYPEKQADKQDASEIKNYTRVPNMLIFGYQNVSPQEKWLYTCLKHMCGKKGTRHLSLRYISEQTGISVGALSTSKNAKGVVNMGMMRHLHDAGLIHCEIKKHGGKGNPQYHVTITDVWALNQDFFANRPKFGQDENEESNLSERLTGLSEIRTDNTPTRSDFGQACPNFVTIPILDNKTTSISKMREKDESGDDASATHRATHNENHSHHCTEEMEDADHDIRRGDSNLRSGDSDGDTSGLYAPTAQAGGNSYSPTRQQPGGQVDANSVVDRGPAGGPRGARVNPDRGSVSRVPGIVPAQPTRRDALAPGTLRAERGQVNGPGNIPTEHRGRASEHSRPASVHPHRADGLIHTAIPATAEHLERVTATQQQAATTNHASLSERDGRVRSTDQEDGLSIVTQVAPSKQKTSKPRARKETPDLFTSLDAAVQAVIVEWQGIFKKPVPVTEALVKQATTLEAFKPEPGEVAACRLWMYQTDTKKWYSMHGMHMGDVAREFEKFRSLADVPQSPKAQVKVVAPPAVGATSVQVIGRKETALERHNRELREMFAPVAGRA